MGMLVIKVIAPGMLSYTYLCVNIRALYDLNIEDLNNATSIINRIVSLDALWSYLIFTIELLVGMIVIR